MRHRDKRRSNSSAVRCQSGVTLIELMISMAVGMFVVLAATALLLSTKSGYLVQDDDAQIQATGRYAIEVVSRAVRQSVYENWDAAEGPVAAAVAAGAQFAGLDARSLKSTTPGIEQPVTKPVNGSDVLAVRFFGSGQGGKGDNTMTNCAGFGVPAASTPQAADDSRGWSVFYVAEDATGEPELYCKYQGDGTWSSQAVARGVETLQVLYGIDISGDGLPNRFANATAVNKLDDALVLAGATAAEREADRQRRTFWKRVVAVKIAVLVRGTHRTRDESASAEYDLFGKDYSNAFSASDPGVRIREATLPKAVRGRDRRIFAATIYLPRRPAPLSTRPT